jgi:hypothetical protein
MVDDCQVGFSISLGNGVCLPAIRENRLTGSELMTPVGAAMRGGSFIMLSYIWVCLGGAIGSGMRFWVSGLIAQRIGQPFPFGTLVVNVTGSFVIGIFAAMGVPEGRWMLSRTAREFLMIGICNGGLVTLEKIKVIHYRPEKPKPE